MTRVNKHDNIGASGSRVITSNSMPYIIAEVGVNHEGSLDRAKELILLAKKGGADGVKFQSYKAEKLAAKNSPSYWDTNKEAIRSQYDLFKKYDAFNKNDYENLAKYCMELQIDFLSTPFDLDAVEFLDPLVPFYKIASADITNVPLMRAIACKLKPIILSTGASTLDEIDFAIEVLMNAGAADVILLHCVLNYPTDDSDAHLNMIRKLKDKYSTNLVGYSDHTIPDLSMTTLVTAYTLGSVVLEKHFTHDKSLPGNDHYHAMDISDLSNLCLSLKKVHALIGDGREKGPLESEKIARENARRSIFYLKDMPAGEIIKESDLICKRPAAGLSPIFWDEVCGKILIKNVYAEDLVNRGDFD